MYSNELVCRILEFLNENLNRKVSIEEISCKFSYNRYYIMKSFKDELGISISVYMNRMRIWNSIIDIQNYSYSLTKIAIRNGFYSLEYFSEMFHQVMGVSPRIYRHYWNHRFLLEQDLSHIILINWITLQEFVEFVDKYKKNKKPVIPPVRKLSIFK